MAASRARPFLLGGTFPADYKAITPGAAPRKPRLTPP
jgi:hypothetical protein